MVFSGNMCYTSEEYFQKLTSRRSSQLLRWCCRCRQTSMASGKRNGQSSWRNLEKTDCIFDTEANVLIFWFDIWNCHSISKLCIISIKCSDFKWNKTLALIPWPQAKKCRNLLCAPWKKKSCPDDIIMNAFLWRPKLAWQDGSLTWPLWCTTIIIHRTPSCCWDKTQKAKPTSLMRKCTLDCQIVY